jgi:hypothetical protein
MKLNFIYKFTGYLSILIGIAAALCIYRPSFMVYGISFSLLGFVIAGVNVFLNLKYYSEEEKYPKGFLGMFLSSVPVLFMLFVIYKAKH